MTLKKMEEENNWHSGIADLMTGLMIVFLLIAVSYMLVIHTSADQVIRQGLAVREITATYSKLQMGLYNDLMDEFREDLPQWGATIEEDSTIRFHEPDILFEPGSSTIRENFKRILRDFFPRYVAVLSSKKYFNEIDEIRIEGHTSSTWQGAQTPEDVYLKNSALSQQRAHSVLTYCYSLDSSAKRRDWLHRVIRANGLSYGHPVLDQSGREDRTLSRRVDFRAVTKSEEKILKIVEELNR